LDAAGFFTHLWAEVRIARKRPSAMGKRSSPDLFRAWPGSGRHLLFLARAETKRVLSRRNKHAGRVSAVMECADASVGTPDNPRIRHPPIRGMAVLDALHGLSSEQDHSWQPVGECAQSSRRVRRDRAAAVPSMRRPAELRQAVQPTPSEPLPYVG